MPILKNSKIGNYKKRNAAISSQLAKHSKNLHAHSSLPARKKPALKEQKLIPQNLPPPSRSALPLPVLTSECRDYHVSRRKMIEQQLKPRGIYDERVLYVMERLPRHWFVDEALITQAYNDSPLNIGLGQTISQPSTVALLAQALSLRGHETILEIGTGCGYQTAVLAPLVKQIYSIERLAPLLMKARDNLRRLKVKNVVLKYGDGSRGWPEKAPFDAIVAAAVSPSIPKPLLEQLAEGGRLVVPIERNGSQFLTCVIREGSSFKEIILSECRFVKMVGDYAFQKKRISSETLPHREKKRFDSLSEKNQKKTVLSSLAPGKRRYSRFL